MRNLFSLLVGGDDNDPVKRQAMNQALSTQGGLWAKLGAYRAAIDNAPMMAERQQILRDAYTPAQAEQRVIDAQVPNPLDALTPKPMPQVVNSPMRLPRMDAAAYKAVTQSAPLPSLSERTIPGKPASLDLDTAMNRLLSIGDVGTAEALAKFQEARQKAMGGDLNWTGTLRDAVDESGNDVLLGMTNRGPEVIKGYRPKGDGPKPPQTRAYEDASGRKVTQEWDGKQYKTISIGPAPVVKPEKPDTLDLGDRAKLEQSFRKEYNGLNSAYTEINRSRGNILTSLDQNTAAGDLAAATSLMKMLDPGSVVRESELAMAQNATGALDRVYNYAQMIRNGQRLNPQQRAEYVRLANSLFENAKRDFETRRADYARMAGEYGLKPENIIGSDSSGPVTVRTPDGKVFTFPDKKAADNFKLKAGIR